MHTHTHIHINSSLEREIKVEQEVGQMEMAASLWHSVGVCVCVPTEATCGDERRGDQPFK